MILTWAVFGKWSRRKENGGILRLPAIEPQLSGTAADSSMIFISHSMPVRAYIDFSKHC
jgi:hypothetical protein